MLRVAQIVPEFCARANSENCVTPCARRNKEFLARGVLYLFNCCTNDLDEGISVPALLLGVSDRTRRSAPWSVANPAFGRDRCVYRFAGTSGELLDRGSGPAKD
jgi:hypothetical protein